MSGYLVSDTRKVTTLRLKEMKEKGEKIAMLTSYDYTMAKLVDAAGVDCILIGDSASNVMAGNTTTLPMTIDQMIYHSRSVARGVKRALVLCDMPFGTYQVNATEAVKKRGVKRALVLCDMPFGTYQVNATEAVKNAIRIMQESGCDALKLEGGVEIIDAVKKIIGAGIPICGHLGLTPQSINKFGTYSVRAKDEAEAQKLISDAKLLEEAGCFAVVLEKIPAKLAKQVSESLSIPTIGIGAGNVCDGQVLVVNDMLGMDKGFSPKFLRRYADLSTVITDAVGAYVTDVKNVDFPNENEQY